VTLVTWITQKLIRTGAGIYQITRSHSLEDCNFNINHCGNFETYFEHNFHFIGIKYIEIYVENVVLKYRRPRLYKSSINPKYEVFCAHDFYVFNIYIM
jgi:hypothetical protein